MVYVDDVIIYCWAKG